MAEADEWAGQMGGKWAQNVEALDRQLGPAGEAGIAALSPRPGEHILDLGCGAGASTVQIAKAVQPSGSVTGIDISPDMLAVARARPDGTGAQFVEANAQDWPFAAAAYDALFSRFGCMFFDDPAKAYANLHRALKPGARVVLVVWRNIERNPWAALPAAACSAVLGSADRPPPGTPGPFGWAESASFAPVLEGAGFSDVAWREAAVELQVGESGAGDPVDRAVSLLNRIGPSARRLKDQPAETRNAVADILAPKLAPFVRDGWVRMPGSVWLIQAFAGAA